MRGRTGRAADGTAGRHWLAYVDAVVGQVAHLLHHLKHHEEETAVDVDCALDSEWVDLEDGLGHSGLLVDQFYAALDNHSSRLAAYGDVGESPEDRGGRIAEVDVVEDDSQFVGRVGNWVEVVDVPAVVALKDDEAAISLQVVEEMELSVFLDLVHAVFPIEVASLFLFEVVFEWDFAFLVGHLAAFVFHHFGVFHVDDDVGAYWCLKEAGVASHDDHFASGKGYLRGAEHGAGHCEKPFSALHCLRFNLWGF